MAYRIFKEEQSFRGTWVMYLILMVELPSLILVSVLVLNEPGRLNEKALTLMLIFSIMMLTFFLLMSIQLKTRIDDDGIHYRYFPFIKWRTIAKDQIHEIKIVQFSPLTDHGGWGIKGNQSTKAYTVIGHYGLEIDLGKKKKVLIGTQKEKELELFLEYWKEVNHAD